MQRVAGAVDGRTAGQREIFNVGPQRIGDAALYGIVSLVRLLGHHIPGTVDYISIVAGSPDEGIVPRPAVQRIVPGPAGEHIDAAVAEENIVQAVAGSIDGGGPG